MATNMTHTAVVDVWLERYATGLPSEDLVRGFEDAFTALWRRAYRTLGEVTLSAIVDRVLYNARARFTFFSSLELEPAGLQCQALREHAHGLRRDQLDDGIRFVLVEFLTVLGNLTANILTPALHAELSKGAFVKRAAEDPVAAGESPSSKHNPEDARS